MDSANTHAAGSARDAHAGHTTPNTSAQAQGNLPARGHCASCAVLAARIRNLDRLHRMKAPTWAMLQALARARGEADALG